MAVSIYKSLNTTKKSFCQIIELQLRRSISDEYCKDIAYKIADDVALNIYETRDESKSFNEDDLKLAIGRVIIDMIIQRDNLCETEQGIKNVFKRYFEEDDNGVPNKQYDECYAAQDALDDIHSYIGKV